MSGDYEFLCHMYGLSGASGMYIRTDQSYHNVHTIYYTGRHCCLWCSIPSDQLKVPRRKRVVTTRTLDTLTQKFREYEDKGGNLKLAKFCDNVIGKRFFNIPLTQVSIKHKLRLLLHVTTHNRYAHLDYIQYNAWYIPTTFQSF